MWRRSFCDAVIARAFFARSNLLVGAEIASSGPRKIIGAGEHPPRNDGWNRKSKIVSNDKRILARRQYPDP
jgi:hypothetical protein